MNENLYEYLCNNKLLLHGIGEIEDNDTLRKFISIFKTGGLYSKKRLKEMGINVEGKVIEGGFREAAESVVSLFDPTIPQIKKRLMSQNYYYFLPFNPKVIFFIINSSHLNLKSHEPNDFEVDEVDGIVPISSFVGIIAPSGYIQLLQEFLENNNINIPLYDFNFNCVNVNSDIISEQKLK